MRLRSGDPEAIGGYPLEARLGAGGMGTVYLARTASGRRIAIKLIHRQYADDEEFRTRFRQEVSAARRVSGAFTAAVVDADPEAEHPWMATAYITGDTLSQRISGHGPLRGVALRTLGVGLAEALRDIHRAGVVHRDLKPSNVVLSPEGPRVIDFGISRAADHQTLTMTGRVIGTPPFMSPEQLQSPRDVGPESDVFSLATLLVYAATGQGPFDADSPYMTAYQVVHEEPALGKVPVPLRGVVEPCLAKEPQGRPTADQLLAQLLALPGDFGAPDPRDGGERRGGERRGGERRGGERRGGDRRGGDRGDSSTDSDSVVQGPHGSRNPRSSRRPWSPRTLTGRLLLRNRRRSVLAAVVAVAAIAGGVALLKPGQDPTGPAASAAESDDGTRTTAASGAKLPTGFRPWRTTVRGGQDITDELRCVPRGASLYCGGGGVVAARLKAADGRAVWKVKSPGVPVQGMHLVGVTGDAPATGGTRATVVGYRQSVDTDAPSEAVALDAGTGKELWSTRLGQPSAAFTVASAEAFLYENPADSGESSGSATGVLSVDTAHTRIEFRQARTGELRWTAPFPSGTRCTPYPPDAQAGQAGQDAPDAADTEGAARPALTGPPPLYAVCAPRAEVETGDVRHPTLHPLDPEDGSLGEAIRLNGRLRPVGTTGDGKLVLVREHWSGAAFEGYDQVAVLDPRTKKLTTRALRGISGSDAAPANGAAPQLVDGTLYFVTPTGRVHAVDPATGRGKWSRQTGAEWASGPVAADGVLYIASPTGRVAALAARDGKLLWGTDPRAESPGGDVGAGPRVAVSGRALIVTAGENTVFGFDTDQPPKSGEQ